MLLGILWCVPRRGAEVKALAREQKLGVAADPDVTIAAGRLASAAATVAAQLRGAAFEASAAAAELSVEASQLEHTLHVHRITNGLKT